MMRLIISQKLEDNFKNYKVVRTFKDIANYNISEISVIVIADFAELDFDAGVHITDIYKMGQNNNLKFIYINEEPSITISMIVSGIKGFIFEDTFYLDDEEELDSLISDLGSIDDSDYVDNSASIVSDFIQSFARGEERIKAPLYLEQVKTAVEELNKVLDKKEYQITAMGESAIDVFSKASEVIRYMSNQKAALEQKLRELAENIDPDMPLSGGQKPTLNNNVQYFPPIRYIKTPKMLTIHEMTPCHYLTTFIVMYVRYLHVKMHKKVKFVVVHSGTFCDSQRYGEFSRIGKDSCDIDSLYSHEFISLSIPRKEVINKLCDNQADLFIFLDRLYQKDCIITGKTKDLFAVGGYNDIKTFGSDPAKTILSVREAPDVFACLKSFKTFPSDPNAQMNAYYGGFQNEYMKLNQYIEI